MTAQANPANIPTADQVVIPASNAVVLEGVDADLIAYAVHLGFIHWLLFGSPLVVTSGKDSVHASGSLHAQGRAIDVRTHDLDPDQELVFLNVLAYSAPARKCTIFDERALPGAAHIHIEYHG